MGPAFSNLFARRSRPHDSSRAHAFTGRCCVARLRKPWAEQHCTCTPSMAPPKRHKGSLARIRKSPSRTQILAENKQTFGCMVSWAACWEGKAAFRKFCLPLYRCLQALSYSHISCPLCPILRGYLVAKLIDRS